MSAIWNGFAGVGNSLIGVLALCETTVANVSINAATA